MKTNIFKSFRSSIAFLMAIPLVFLSSCEEELLPDPVASYQYEISDDNYLEVAFTNYSQDADTYSWDFGDGETSTEENPTHVFAEAGNYTVVLTASNSDGASATYDESIEIVDPNEALKLLTGEVSKTWKLYRVDNSMGVGPSIDDPYLWWSLQNDGSRPCVYQHEFTFTLDGDYIFDDKGSFWGEGLESGAVCIDATADNMVTEDGADVSAWLGGTHAFEYEPSTGMVTLTGEGAWIGLPKVATDGEVTEPQNSVSFKVDIEEHDGFDLMFVQFIYADFVWVFNYASYTDESLEPELVTETAPWGEDLADVTPDDIEVTFASRDAADLVTIDTVASGSSVVFGVEDPLDGTAAKVGKFIRTADVEYQELQFRTVPDPLDIQFDNFTTAKIDIYVPADTDFTTLQRHFVFGFADMSQTQEWWGSPVQFVKENDDVVLGEWTTYTFDLADVKAREDLDMIYLGMGGGGHTAEGIFYVRNLIFE